MGIILAASAIFLLYVLSPILILYGIIRLWNFKKISDHFFDVAVAIDKLGNVLGASLFSDLMITKNGIPFGLENETISSTLGRNYLSNKLKPIGKMLRWILDLIQPNHCVNSIGK